MSSDRLEQLRAKLLSRDVVVEDVWDYLALNHRPLAGMQTQPLATFIDEKDIPSFWWLHDWWEPVQNKPPTMPTPTIAQFCWNINYMPGTTPLTFDQALRQFYERAKAACEQIGLNPDEPSESADERKRRRNRERMAAVRGHRKVPDKLIEHDKNLLLRVRDLEAVIDSLKAEAKQEDELMRQEVVSLQSRMIIASNKRKTVAANFKERIENIQKEIRSLTAKQ